MMPASSPSPCQVLSEPLKGFTKGLLGLVEEEGTGLGVFGKAGGAGFGGTGGEGGAGGIGVVG